MFQRKQVRSAHITWCRVLVLLSWVQIFFQGENVLLLYPLTALDIQAAHTSSLVRLSTWADETTMADCTFVSSVRFSSGSTESICRVWNGQLEELFEKVSLYFQKSSKVTSVIWTQCWCVPARPVCDALCKRSTGRRSNSQTGQSSAHETLCVSLRLWCTSIHWQIRPMYSNEMCHSGQLEAILTTVPHFIKEFLSWTFLDAPNETGEYHSCKSCSLTTWRQSLRLKREKLLIRLEILAVRQMYQDIF